MRAQFVALCCLGLAPSVFLIPLYQFEEYADELKATRTPYTNPPLKTGIKERFKQFLRKAIYGITPTTVYTTLVPMKFPEEYDPIKMLEWQLAQEKLRGLTTPDHPPALTDKTNLWDGYFNDPTFEAMTFWSMREEQANRSRPNRLRKVDRYWEPDWRGHRASDEAIAKMWKKWALEENKVYYRTHTTQKNIPIEDMTYDSVDKVKWVANSGESHWDSADRRLITQAEQDAWEEWAKEHGPYVYRGHTTSEEDPPTTYPPRTSTIQPRQTESNREENKKQDKHEKKKDQKPTKKLKFGKDTEEISISSGNPIPNRAHDPKPVPETKDYDKDDPFQCTGYLPTYSPKKR